MLKSSLAATAMDTGLKKILFESRPRHYVTALLLFARRTTAVSGVISPVTYVPT